MGNPPARSFGCDHKDQADDIVVALPGGPMDDASEVAYFGSFKAKTSVSVVKTAKQYAKLKAMVDVGAVEWDVMDCAADRGATNLLPAWPGQEQPLGG